jgi:nicotinamidase-related amidase
MSTIEAKPFAFPFDGKWRPETVAIIVVDIQSDFLSETGYFARKGYDPSPLRTIIPNVAAILEAARETGCHVVWTRQGYRADLADLTEYERWRCKRAGITFDGPDVDRVLTRAASGYDIVPELTVMPGEPLVEKTANGAFYQTDLDMILRTAGIQHLIFTGCTTEVCVSSTMREAADRKYQCLLVEDACASSDRAMHDAAVEMVMVEDGIFGVVADTQAVLNGLGELAHNSG